jgi:hypothetical protein
MVYLKSFVAYVAIIQRHCNFTCFVLPKKLHFLIDVVSKLISNELSEAHAPHHSATQMELIKCCFISMQMARVNRCII